MNSERLVVLALFLIVMSSCTRLKDVGQVPDFSPSAASTDYFTVPVKSYPRDLVENRLSFEASLWNISQNSFLQNRKASTAGDIVTVVIEIDDEAQWSNSSDRSRSGSEELQIDELFGLPTNIAKQLPTGADTNELINTESTSSSEGDGNISRREKLALRIAATVVGEMPNGILQITGTQEVRVNFELRELTVSGFVRPQDISRRNEVDYDRLASARISYGGRGQITDVQQPRFGQQIADIVLPF
ncbi:MAG: flagellar basal body L-ring protein FlgH [Pseudomonadota bacterium]